MKNKLYGMSFGNFPGIGQISGSSVTSQDGGNLAVLYMLEHIVRSDGIFEGHQDGTDGLGVVAVAAGQGNHSHLFAEFQGFGIGPFGQTAVPDFDAIRFPNCTDNSGPPPFAMTDVFP